MKQKKNFLYLSILLLFIIFIYSRQYCYPKFGSFLFDFLDNTFSIKLEFLNYLPIQTYGFFIAMAFLFGALFLKEELQRLHIEKKIKAIKRKKENKYENIFGLFFSFFIGYQLAYIINNYQDFFSDPQVILSLHLDSEIKQIFLCLTGGLLFSSLSFYVNKTRKPIEKEFIEPHELIGTLLGVTLISGVLGAKLFYLFEDGISWKNLISFGGLTFYGGLICGTLGVIIYAKKNRISIPHIADAFAPILMLAYAIGRVGCQASGDGCWGVSNTIDKPNLIPDWLWSSQYINGTSSQILDINQFVWPTPIYETFICLIIFGILWSIRKKLKTGGLLFSIYLILNGTERFFIETIRVNEKVIFNLTQGQIIAITLFLTGTILSLYLLKKKKNAII